MTMRNVDRNTAKYPSRTNESSMMGSVSLTRTFDSNKVVSSQWPDSLIGSILVAYLINYRLSSCNGSVPFLRGGAARTEDPEMCGID
jgi:hypothetical protein